MFCAQNQRLSSLRSFVFHVSINPHEKALNKHPCCNFTPRPPPSFFDVLLSTQSDVISFLCKSLFCATRDRRGWLISWRYLAVHSTMNLHRVFYSGVYILIAEFPPEIICSIDRQLGEKREHLLSWKCNEKDKGDSKHLKWKTVSCVILLNPLVQQAEIRRRRSDPFGSSEGSVKETPVFLSPAISSKFTLARLPCQNSVFWTYPAEMRPFSCYCRGQIFRFGKCQSTLNLSVMKVTTILCKCVRIRDAVGGTLRDTMSLQCRATRGPCIMHFLPASLPQLLLDVPR